jgi:membrane associated rhomboid family serine protease
VAVSQRLSGALGEEKEAALRESRATWEASRPLPPVEQLRREQKDFDALVDDYFAALERLPWYRFGFVPARPALLALLTAMFMHAGWLHLLGNMVFLYASGPYIEEAYGRTVYAAAYVLSGLAATLAHALAAPQSTIPLVGASGAIAGLMGIMLVRLARSRITFLFLPILFLPNVRIRLTIPALVVLPLWALEQLWYAGRTPAGAGGVAWWAHLGGFAFGIAFAAIVMALHVEERWLGRSAEADEGRRALDKAAAARESGDFERAHAELERARAAEPDATGILLETYELALAEGDPAEVGRAMTRLLEILPRRGEASAAMELVDDGRWAIAPDTPPRLFFSVASFLDRQGQAERALALYDQVIEAAPGDALSLRAAVRKGELQIRSGQADAARRTLEGAASHPALDDQWRVTIDRALVRLEPTNRPRTSARARTD